MKNSGKLIWETSIELTNQWEKQVAYRLKG